jgi:anti-sigma regulatory factor (Ser/Thr protein kinase)
MEFGPEDLPELRRIARNTAIDVGLPQRRADDLALAVNEVATNAIVHGRPPTTVRIRPRPGELVWEVSDTGAGIRDPFEGGQAPPIEASRGRGLWLARRLCDAVKIRSGVGCTVTLRMEVGARVGATA